MVRSESLMLHGWRALAFLGDASGLASAYDDEANCVLRYHSVGGGFYDEISPDRLRRDIEYLDERYEIVDLPEVLGSSGTRRVALTFDDGYQDFYEHVVPVLHEYDVPATVFVIADAIDDPSFVHNDAFDYDYMGREELQDLLEDDLVTVGNHTRTHPDLSSLPSDRLKEEIVDAQQRLEETLGTDIRRFCYPYCKYDDRAVELVRETHDLGVAGRGRREAVSIRTDPAVVPRVIGANPPWEVRWDLSGTATLLGSAIDRLLGSSSGPSPSAPDGDGPSEESVVDGSGHVTDGGERLPDDAGPRT